MGGSEDDPVARITGGISALGGELAHIKDAVVGAAERTAQLMRAHVETQQIRESSVPPPSSSSSRCG